MPMWRMPTRTQPACSSGLSISISVSLPGSGQEIARMESSAAGTIGSAAEKASSVAYDFYQVARGVAYLDPAGDLIEAELQRPQAGTDVVERLRVGHHDREPAQPGRAGR